MARLLLILLVGAAAWYGWRAFRRQQARVVQAMKDAEGKLRKSEAIELKKDPKTGVYRASDRRE